jgi:glyoxylase-like metal-dependent hydrolase (beta-lactamase superfamily II)
MLPILRVLAPNPGVYELEGTNTWVVGPAPAIVIDPGPDVPSHLEEVARTAGRVGAIVLTHDHPDHAPGAMPLAEMTRAPIHAARPPEAGTPIRDGQVVSSGGASLRAVATPGHSSDHLAWWLEDERALFTGDAVLGRGTSVIDPPEGDLAAYLRSLRKMRDLGPRTIHPGHGPVVLRGVEKLEEYLAHRQERERQIVEALATGPRSVDELVATIYAAYPADVRPLAARSVVAHLLKLAGEGRVDDTTKDGVKRYVVVEPRACARCGRPVKGKGKYCGPCSLAILQGTG